MTVAVFAGFQTLENSRILQYFEWFSWKSGQNSQNLEEIYGLPVMLTKHFLQDFQCRPWGGVDIFWNSPLKSSKKLNAIFAFWLIS